MGSSVLGLLRAVLVSTFALVLARPALAQVPTQGPAPELEPPPPPPPPAAEPAPAAPEPPPPAPPPPPPALEPPPPPEASKPPAFLHTREEMERLQGGRADRDRPAPQPDQSGRPATSAPLHSKPDFLGRASPWVDVTLTSFALEDRVDNFFNFGAQAGAYLFEWLRVSARVAAPLDEVRDSYSSYSSGGSRQIDSRSLSVIYGASAGLVITNSRSFVFAPSLALLRTDVEAYGSAWFVALPFEWTTRSHLRVGFELGLGKAFDGTVRTVCFTGTPARSCGVNTQDRPSGTAVLGQFYMGWALGSL